MRCLIGHIARVVILLCCVVIMAQAWSLYDATERAGYTRHFDPERAKQSAENQGGLADLFEEEAEVEPIDRLDNRFRFGLAPSAYPWSILDKHHASLLTTGGPAAVIALLTIGSWFVGCPRREPESDPAASRADSG